MNDLSTINQQLPDTIEDLSKFVLVGKAKLQAYMMKLQTINRLSVAQEVRDQTLQEAQEVSTALIAAEQRIGELLLSIPKATGNQYTSANSTQVEKAKTKSETISDMGYTKDEASDYQQMARYPEVVQKVLDDALANGDIVTKSSVVREIKFYKDRIRTLEEQAKNPVTKEVIPGDYAEAKKQARTNKAAYEELMAKYTKKCNEALRLQDQIVELKQVTQEGLENNNLSENVFYFCTLANNFVGNVGGLVWLTERIDDMGAREKELFLKAAQALNDFSQVFRQNMERINYDKSNNYGRREVPALSDKR